MKGDILVLGAAGRLGFVAAETFRDAGWRVKGLVRPGRSGAVPRKVKAIEAVTRDEAVAAAQGCEVVLNAFNPVVTEWQKNALSLAYAAIAAAEGSGATLLFPGSVWNYGRSMPPVLNEATPMTDFFGGGSGSWFDLVIAKDIGRGRLTYPGPLGVEHEWAYLPDFAATFVRLAEQRANFSACESFGFPGYAVTGQEFVATIEAVTKSKFTLRPMSWWMIKTVGQLLAMGRELSELEYLWRVPHRIADDKLKAAIGQVPHTPLPEAIAASLRAIGYKA
jgi:nucleoside-diphosphate-sugar epimerase